MAFLHKTIYRFIKFAVEAATAAVLFKLEQPLIFVRLKMMLYHKSVYLQNFNFDVIFGIVFFILFLKCQSSLHSFIWESGDIFVHVLQRAYFRDSIRHNLKLYCPINAPGEQVRVY